MKKQTNNSENESKFTTVKTIYARAAVVLLALNFCLTGYVTMNMNKITQELIDAQTSTPNAQLETAAVKQD